MTRFIKRGGKIWIRVFPDKPITKKPQETRMGKGKGAPEEWVCVVRPGRILFEMEGVNETDARKAMRLAAAKLSDQDAVRDAVRARRRRHEGGGDSATSRSTSCSSARRTCDDQLFRLRIQKSMGQLEAAHKLKALRRDLARVKTGAAREGDGGKRWPPRQSGHWRVSSATRWTRRVVVAVERQIRDDALRQDPAADVDVPGAQRGERRQGRRPRRDRRDAPAQPPQALGRHARRREGRRRSRRAAMIQMRSILDVADNSGARKIAAINPIGGSTGRLRAARRHHHRVGEGSDARRRT